MFVNAKNFHLNLPFVIYRTVKKFSKSLIQLKKKCEYIFSEIKLWNSNICILYIFLKSYTFSRKNLKIEITSESSTRGSRDQQVVAEINLCQEDNHSCESTFKKPLVLKLFNELKILQ